MNKGLKNFFLTNQSDFFIHKIELQKIEQISYQRNSLTLHYLGRQSTMEFDKPSEITRFIQKGLETNLGLLLY